MRCRKCLNLCASVENLKERELLMQTSTHPSQQKLFDLQVLGQHNCLLLASANPNNLINLSGWLWQLHWQDTKRLMHLTCPSMFVIGIICWSPINWCCLFAILFVVSSTQLSHDLNLQAGYSTRPVCIQASKISLILFVKESYMLCPSSTSAVGTSFAPTPTSSRTQIKTVALNSRLPVNSEVLSN